MSYAPSPTPSNSSNTNSPSLGINCDVRHLKLTIPKSISRASNPFAPKSLSHTSPTAHSQSYFSIPPTNKSIPPTITNSSTSVTSPFNNTNNNNNNHMYDDHKFMGFNSSINSSNGSDSSMLFNANINTNYNNNTPYIYNDYNRKSSIPSIPKLPFVSSNSSSNSPSNSSMYNNSNTNNLSEGANKPTNNNNNIQIHKITQQEIGQIFKSTLPSHVNDPNLHLKIEHFHYNYHNNHNPTIIEQQTVNHYNYYFSSRKILESYLKLRCACGKKHKIANNDDYYDQSKIIACWNGAKHKRTMQNMNIEPYLICCQKIFNINNLGNEKNGLNLHLNEHRN